jgi:hypothetical protein
MPPRYSYLHVKASTDVLPTASSGARREDACVGSVDACVGSVDACVMGFTLRCSVLVLDLADRFGRKSWI